MNDFQRYLLDEFVDDYRAGRMSRRDFVMKVIGVCGGLAAASGLFSSVGLSTAEIAAAQAEPRVAQAQPNAVTVSPDDDDIDAVDELFPTVDGSTLQGYVSVPVHGEEFAGIVLIHENRGLTEHHKDVVRRFAKAGMVAVAPDLVSREGGTASVSPDDVPGLLARADPQRHVQDARAAGIFVRDVAGVRSDAFGMIGFCFGGGVVWRTIGQDQAVAAAVPFYGPAPPPDLLGTTHAATLGIYAELDTNITSSAPSVMEVLTTAGVPHDFLVYQGANHAFFNNTGERYNPAAAADAWARTLAWFRQYLPPIAAG